MSEENQKNQPVDKNPEKQELNNDPIDEMTFFNVMPSSHGDEKIMQPVIEIKKNEPLNQGDNTSSKIKDFIFKYKVYVIVGVLLILIAPIIYLVINKFAFKTEENDLLVANPENFKKKPEIKTEEINKIFTTTKEWQLKYWGKEDCTEENVCADSADPDQDGLKNLEEFQKNTDPNNPDSDKDGIADGDEILVFETDPLSAHSFGNEKYTDLDDIKSGYFNGKLLQSQQILEINKRMQQFGLHEPSIEKTGIDNLNKIYNFIPKAIQKIETTVPTTTPSTSPVTIKTPELPKGTDTSLEAKQDRDVQRSDAIKKVLIALNSYKNDNQTYPKNKNFKDMYATVKVYLGGIATNPEDPINIDPMIYTYTVNEKADDFVLTFYSEVANQQIKKKASDSVKEGDSKSANFNDATRKNDLEILRNALLLYSQKLATETQDYVFPIENDYKTAIAPDYVSQIPKDPKTGKDYEYKVSEGFDTFTLKSILENPKPGTSGYLCNQEECREY